MVPSLILPELPITHSLGDNIAVITSVSYTVAPFMKGEVRFTINYTIEKTAGNTSVPLKFKFYDNEGYLIDEVWTSFTATAGEKSKESVNMRLPYGTYALKIFS